MDQTNFVMKPHMALSSLPPIVHESIARFTGSIQTKLSNWITRIILFGSYARGDFNAESDVDILVLTTDDSWDMIKQIMDTGFDFYPDCAVLFSAKAMTEELFEKKKIFSFMQEVLREGITIV